jgi:hypothetical protein
MPRESRAKKVEAVIPSNSLVASAVRYSGEAARIYRPTQDWQQECYRHYAICGEARFAARFFGHAVSRASLFPARRDARGPKRQTSGKSVTMLEQLFNGKDGQSQMLESIGIHLIIAGECYLVGRTIDGQDTWEIVSVLEMKVSGTKWTIDYGDGMQPVELSKQDVVIRIWVPSPERRIEADSPFRSLLPILSEIEWLTRHIFAQTSSRLAGAGIYWVPQEMDFPPPPVGEDGKPVAVSNKAEGLMRTLADSMLTPVNDPGSPAAMVPIIVSAPGEMIDKAKLQHFWSELDGKALEMRAAAISRFADGMDLPREQVLGMSSNSGTGGGNSNGISHWGAWQVEESTIKLFIEPMLETVCNALTIGYLRPLLDDSAIDFVHYETSLLRLRPDRSKEAGELYDRGAISREALLRENGFDTTDLPKPEEFKEWLLRKVATGSATPEMVNAALKVLGVDLGPLPEEQGPMNESRPDPSLEEHPEPRHMPELPEAASAVLAASDALVWRALERAGNRIRQNAGIKPPGVPAYEMHTLHSVNGGADAYLNDAWSCAPQVLDGLTPDVQATVDTLDAYCRSLFAEQAPHSRDRLKGWLEATS